MNKCKGLTLVELLVTLTIVMVTSITAITNYQDLYARYRVKMSVEEMRQQSSLPETTPLITELVFRFVQLKTIYVQMIGIINSSFLLIQAKRAITKTGEKIIFTQPQLSIKDIIIFNRAAIRFQPDGLAGGSNGTLRFCPPKPFQHYAAAIIINRSGRSRLSKQRINCS